MKKDSRCVVRPGCFLAHMEINQQAACFGTLRVAPGPTRGATATGAIPVRSAGKSHDLDKKISGPSGKRLLYRIDEGQPARSAQARAWQLEIRAADCGCDDRDASRRGGTSYERSLASTSISLGPGRSGSRGSATCFFSLIQLGADSYTN